MSEIKWEDSQEAKELFVEVITLRETLRQKENEITDLRSCLAHYREKIAEAKKVLG